MAFCAKCGALLEEGSNVCAKCGTRTEQKAPGARCAFCGNLIEQGLHYCSYCGADLSEEPPVQSEAPAVRREAPGPQPAAAPVQPAGPEQELYRRGMVTWLNGLISVIGTLTISTHRLVFTPSKLYLGTQTLEVPAAQITGANTAKTMVAIPGGMQVQTADGKTYSFSFGAVYAGEADRAVQAIRQAIGGLR